MGLLCNVFNGQCRGTKLMKNFQRLSLILLPIMTFALPFWLTFGRIMAGSAGWLTILYMVFVAPVLLVAMLALNILAWLQKDVRRKAELSRIDAFLLLAFYISVFFHGFFLVDGGDSEDSLNSVMTLMWHNRLLDLSTFLSSAALWLSLLLLITCIVVFIRELRKRN